MPTPAPTPSSLVTPLVVQLAGGDPTPWWGVPAIAGVFLLVGGVLTALYTRRNDSIRADRDRKANWDADVLDKGAEFLAAGDEVRNIGVFALGKSARQMVTLVVQEKEVADNFIVAGRRFALVMPKLFQEEFRSYFASTTMLIVPPYQREGQLDALAKHAEASWKLESQLRSLRSLDPLGSGNFDSSRLPDLAETAMGSLFDEILRESREKE